ncbi:hypothetical protein [Streptomyces sp. NPDC055056]
MQRMVSGTLVPTRDVVLDLLQLLEDRGVPLDREAVEKLWRLYRPALRTRRPDVAEAYDIIDERDTARTQADRLLQQVQVLQADQSAGLLRLTHAGLRLLTAHRALALSQKELESTARSVELVRAGEQQAREHLEAAVDRLDRLKDAYEHLREEALAVQQNATKDHAQWQERQADLLERLSLAEEALARTVQDTQDARQELQDERRISEAARRTAHTAQESAGQSRTEAAAARQEAAASEARRLTEAAAAQRTIQDAESDHAQALNAITQLEEELGQARTELKTARRRLVRADAELLRTTRERAVEADAQDVLSQALTAIKDDAGSTQHRMIPAGPESIGDTRSQDIPADRRSTRAAPHPNPGMSNDAPPRPGASDPERRTDDGPQAKREAAAGITSRPRSGRPLPGEAELAQLHGGTDPYQDHASPQLRRAIRYRPPGYHRRLALLVAAAVTVAAGVPALVWWSYRHDTPLVHGREEPTGSGTPKAKKTPSLPPRPAADSVADIGDQPVNTSTIMKLPPCTGAGLSLRLSSERNTYSGADPHLTLTMKTTKDTDTVPCRVNASRTDAPLTITAAGQRTSIWKSSACTDGHSGPRWLQASHNRPATIDFHWKQIAGSKHCDKQEAVPYATYLAEVSLAGAAPAQTSFVLESKESSKPSATPTRTPSPSRSASGNASASSGGSSGSIGGLLSGGTAQTPSTKRASPSSEATSANGGGGANGGTGANGSTGGGDDGFFGGGG